MRGIPQVEHASSGNESLYNLSPPAHERSRPYRLSHCLRLEPGRQALDAVSAVATGLRAPL